jgi:hypothetical protein
MTADPSKTKSTLTSLAAEMGLVPADKAQRREADTDAPLDRGTAVLGEDHDIQRSEEGRDRSPGEPRHDMAREAAEHEVAMREAKREGTRPAGGIVPGAATKMPPD